MKRGFEVLLVCLCSSLALCGIAGADDRPLVLDPAPDHAVVGIRVEATFANPIVGIEWRSPHNDLQVPTILACIGEGKTPNLAAAVAVATDIATSDTTRVMFESSIVSPTGEAWLLVELPDDLATGASAMTMEETGDSSRAAVIGCESGGWVYFGMGAQPAMYALRAGETTLARSRSTDPVTLGRSSAGTGAWWERASQEAGDGGVVDSRDEEEAPARVTLDRPLAGFPSPFNPRTTIQYLVPTTSYVSLTVYDLRGRRVRQLVDEVVTTGVHSVVWGGDDDLGSAVASGVYFVRLDNAERTHSQRVVLVR